MPRKLALPVTAMLCLLVAGCVSNTGIKSVYNKTEMPKESAASKQRDGARIHTELGRRYMQRGELQLALKKLKKALSFDSSYVPAHTVIAVLYERIGKAALAEKHYRAAQRLDQAKGSVNNNLGQFLCKHGQVKESLGYFTKALDDPFYGTPAMAYVNAGTCLAKIGRNDDAAARFRSALEIKPRDAEALLGMARILARQQDYFHARAFVERFNALGQPRPSALLLGYRIESNLGEREAARDYANELREMFPDSTQARSLQGH